MFWVCIGGRRGEWPRGVGIQKSLPPLGDLAQNKTPRTRFESEGAQSISPPPSAAQPQNKAATVPSEWHRDARRHHLKAIQLQPPRLNLHPLAAGHFRER